MGNKNNRKKASPPAPVRHVGHDADKEASVAVEVSSTGAHSPQSEWRTVLNLAGVVLVLGAIGLVPLTLWRIPTRIATDLVVKRLEFTTAHDTPQVTITDQPTRFGSLTLEGVFAMRFKPARLETVAPGTRATQRLAVVPGSDVTVHGDEPGASISIVASDGAKAGAGRLESFSARAPAVVTIGTTPGTPATFALHIAGPMQAPAILPSGPVDLSAQHITLTGAGAPAQHERIQLRAQLAESSPQLETQSGAHGMTVIVTPAGSEQVRFLGKGGTAVDKVELISQNSRGEVESSIAGDGIISFPDYPDKKSVVVKESDGLSVADFAGMSITTLAFDPQRGLLQVRLEGKAGKVRLRSGTAFTDHRVTLLDWLRHSPYLEGLYFLFVAVLSGLLKGLHVEELWHRARHAWVKPA